MFAQCSAGHSLQCISLLSVGGQLGRSKLDSVRMQEQFSTRDGEKGTWDTVSAMPNIDPAWRCGPGALNLTAIEDSRE